MGHAYMRETATRCSRNLKHFHNGLAGSEMLVNWTCNVILSLKQGLNADKLNLKLSNFILKKGIQKY